MTTRDRLVATGVAVTELGVAAGLLLTGVPPADAMLMARSMRLHARPISVALRSRRRPGAPQHGVGG